MFTVPKIFVMPKKQKRGKLQVFSQNCIMIPHSLSIFADMFFIAADISFQQMFSIL
jgi:hypothetical protein